MTVYRLIALLADLNTLPCVNPQVYQARGVAVAKFTLHIVPLSGCLCPYHTKKGYPDPTQGKDIPYKKAQKGGYRRLPVRGCFCVQAFYATATGSLLRLRLRFGFASASGSAVVGSASGSAWAWAVACFCASSALLVIIGITTT